MHTLWLFLNWPNGTAWSNVIAMPLCAVLAALAAFLLRDRIGQAVSGWWHRHFGHRAELDAIGETLKGHADALDLETPGGLAAVIAEVREAKSASESALAEVRALIAISGPGQATRRGGATPMRKTATGKAEGEASRRA